MMKERKCWGRRGGRGGEEMEKKSLIQAALVH